MNDSQTDKHVHNSISRPCLNCNQMLRAGESYCASCGQKVLIGLPSLWMFLKEFLASLFNFDTKFFRTLFKLWVPGQLTKEYIAGKRKKYFNPARLFFFTLIVLFALIRFSISQHEEEIQIGTSTTDQITLEVLRAFDTLSTQYSHIPEIDTLRDSLFSKTLPEGRDTLPVEEPITINIIGNVGYKLTTHDIYHSKIEDVYERQGKDMTFWDKLVLKQYIRIVKDPIGTMKYGVGNVVWGLIVMVIILAFFFKFLYLRHQIYYVEHLVFLLNVHSAFFVITSVVVVLFEALSIREDIGIAQIFFPIFLFISMKIYYQQGWLKTMFKFLFLTIFYIFVLTLLVCLVALVSMAMF